jgi:hypothetical protein
MYEANQRTTAPTCDVLPHYESTSEEEPQSRNTELDKLN